MGAAAMLCASAILLVACSSGATTASSTSTTADTTDGVVWLCRPGVSPDPCTQPVTSTSVDGDGHSTVATVQPAASAPVDCFYV